MNLGQKCIKTFLRKTFCIPDIPLRDADAKGGKTVSEKSYMLEAEIRKLGIIKYPNM